MKHIAIFFVLCFFVNNAYSSTLIRDVEIEQVLKEISTPLFKAGNINPNSINIYIIQDKEINAFVSGGRNLFIYTGLLTEFNDVNIIQGVIAHEAGHIVAGHISKKSKDIEEINNGALYGMALGLATAVAGAPDVGWALILGTSHSAGRVYLRHSRKYEDEADQIATNILKKTKTNPAGLIKLLDYLYKKNMTLAIDPDPYMLTHPIEKSRISHIKNIFLEDHSKFNEDAKLQEKYKRIVAKLKGFLQKPDHTLKTYYGNDFSSLYARSIALHKKGKSEEAINLIDKLLVTNNDDFFLYELKAQIYYESGKLKESAENYEKAISINDKEALTKIELAITYIALSDYDNKMKNLQKALILLKDAINLEPKNITAFHELAILYGKLGDKPKSYLSMAQRDSILNNQESSLKYAKQAIDGLTKNSPEFIAAQDIILLYEK